jgi:radical SAM protein with 4Fe4S-binding SPASM domain
MAVVFKTGRRFAYPISISVEPTTACNLSCVQCPVGMKTLTREQGEMDFDLFKTIIDEVAPYISSVILYFQGEPFMSRDFFRCTEYASKTKKIYTISSTNGHYLSESNSHKIIESGLDELIISLDGISAESYEAYRKGGNVNVVMRNIERLLTLRKDFGASSPKVILQTLLLKSNRHEIEAIKQFAKSVGADKMEFKSAQFYNFEEGHALMPENPKHSRYIKDKSGNWKLKGKIKNRCRRLWETAVVTWNGDVLPCCFDKNAEHVFGNIREASFKTIDRGEKARAFRRKLLKNRADIEICRNCTEF